MDDNWRRLAQYLCPVTARSAHDSLTSLLNASFSNRVVFITKRLLAKQKKLFQEAKLIRTLVIKISLFRFYYFAEQPKCRYYEISRNSNTPDFSTLNWLWWNKIPYIHNKYLATETIAFSALPTKRDRLWSENTKKYFTSECLSS